MLTGWRFQGIQHACESWVDMAHHEDKWSWVRPRVIRRARRITVNSAPSVARTRCMTSRLTLQRPEWYYYLGRKTPSAQLTEACIINPDERLSCRTASRWQRVGATSQTLLQRVASAWLSQWAAISKPLLFLEKHANVVKMSQPRHSSSSDMKALLSSQF